MRLAGAPISWGVCEVPDWGVQLAPELVLSQMAALGLAATEAGPPGFLPEDLAAARSLLRAHGLHLVGAFVAAVLHDASSRSATLAEVKAAAERLSALGAEVLVLAAATGRTGYSATVEIDDRGWATLFATLDDVARIASRHDLVLAVHPHWGTVIERAHHVERFLGGCSHGLCLDTGHIALGGADPVRIAALAGARVRHVHLKDVDGALASDVRAGSLDYAAAVRRGLFVRLGAGDARIGEVLALLRSAGYGGWYVLEQDVMLGSVIDHPPSDVLRSMSFMRRHA